MHKQGSMDSGPSRLVADNAGVRSVADKGIAMKCNPLAGIFAAVRDEPLLLSAAITSSLRREISHHHLIVAGLPQSAVRS